MAASTINLRMYFKDASGNEVSHTLRWADKTKAANVRALMEGMIVNGDIFETPPAAVDSAEFIETITTPVTM